MEYVYRADERGGRIPASRPAKGGYAINRIRADTVAS
jgi:hypothetical protein